jgi:hypothetical protein
MIRNPLKVALILVAMLMTLSIGAKAVGALQPPNPALRGFVEGCEHKPQPCWYGIVPGITTVQQAIPILNHIQMPYRIASLEYRNSINYSVPCRVMLEQPARPNTALQSITLEGCQDYLAFENVLAVLGSPQEAVGSYPGSLLPARKLPRMYHLSGAFLTDMDIIFYDACSNYLWSRSTSAFQYIDFDPVQTSFLAC